MDAACPTEPRALRGYVGIARTPRCEQPLADRCIETARDRILNQGSSEVIENRPKLESCLTTGGAWTHNSDIDRAGPIAPGLNRQHRIRRFEHDCDPARTVVGPGCIHNRGPINLQNIDDIGDLLFGRLAAANQRRSRERKATSIATNVDEPCAALLYNDVRALRF